MQTTGDVDDPSGDLGCTAGEDLGVNQGSEEERREVVGLELELEAVGGLLVIRGIDSCVVDQDLQVVSKVEYTGLEVIFVTLTWIGSV